MTFGCRVLEGTLLTLVSRETKRTSPFPGFPPQFFCHEFAGRSARVSLRRGPCACGMSSTAGGSEADAIEKVTKVCRLQPEVQPRLCRGLGSWKTCVSSNTSALVKGKQHNGYVLVRGYPFLVLLKEASNELKWNTHYFGGSTVNKQALQRCLARPAPRPHEAVGALDVGRAPRSKEGGGFGRWGSKSGRCTVGVGGIIRQNWLVCVAFGFHFDPFLSQSRLLGPLWWAFLWLTLFEVW